MHTEFSSVLLRRQVARYSLGAQHAPRSPLHATEMEKRPRTEDSLATNLRYLMKLRGWTEEEVSRRTRGRVSQKTINNILHKRYRVKSDTADDIAEAFGLAGWLLIMPNLVRDIESGGTIAKLIESYLDSSDEGKRLILNLAEREAKTRTG